MVVGAETSLRTVVGVFSGAATTLLTEAAGTRVGKEASNNASRTWELTDFTSLLENRFINPTKDVIDRDAIRTFHPFGSL